MIVCEKLSEAAISDLIQFEAVKLIGTGSYTILGRPNIESARVIASIEQQTLAQKVLVFKKKRRKGYKRSQGHRQELTVIRINRIEHEITDEMKDRAVSLGI